jgi:zinc and cadmium transporter
VTGSILESLVARSMSAAVASLGSVLLVSLVSLVGLATLSLNEARMRRLAVLLVSFAVGALLGDAFIHLIPESFGDSAEPMGPSLLILAGMLLFFVVEKLLRHRHSAIHEHHHPDHNRRPELAAINVFGDAVHNFIDGVLIAASCLVNPLLGISTTIAVLLHEIPQELGDFGVLVHSGVSARRAILLNLASASAAIAGTVATLLVGASLGGRVTATLVPVTAGGFVYIAAADLIPELQHDRSLRALLVQAGIMSLGIAVMAMLTLLE